MSNDAVEIIEVGPRDGLQNEKVIFSTKDKLSLIDRARRADLRRIEVASFVNPKRVPQMADAEEVIAELPDDPAVTYVGLVLNERGLARALATRDGGVRGVDEVGAVAIASDTFGIRNQGQNSEESVAAAKAICRRASAEGMSAQVTLSAAWGCPFEGEVDPKRVVDMARDLAEAAPKEIALADTIGVAVPARVAELIAAVQEAVRNTPLRVHFHDTRNTGVANVWAAFRAGVRRIDASLGGLGGCPFAPAATGNVATEDVVYMLERSGVSTGVNLEALIGGAAWLSEHLARPTPGMVGRAGGFPQASAA